MMKILCKPSKQQAGSIFLTDMVACTSCDFQHVDLHSRIVPTVKCLGVILLRIANGPRVHLLYIIVNCPGDRVQGEDLLWHTDTNLG